MPIRSAHGPVLPSRWSLCLILLATICGRPSQSQTVQSEPPPPQTLETGVPFDRELKGGERHRYAVMVAAGEAARITAEQRGIEIGLRLLDPAGKLLVYVDAEADKTRPERLVIAPNEAASFILQVEARYPRDPGAAYRIVLDTSPATADDRAAYESRRLWMQSEEAQGTSTADALQLATKALGLVEGMPLPDPQWLAELLSKVGDLQATAGNRAEAERQLERAITVADQGLGRDHPQSTASRVRLGNFYMSALGDYLRAEPLLEEGVAATERVLGPSHPRVAGHIINLALLYTLRRDYDRALPLLERGLEIAERRIDERDFTYMSLVNNLGDLFLQQDQYEKAEPYVTRALRMIEDRYGAEHIRTANPVANLGIIARERKDYPRALQLFDRAYTVRAKVLGPTNSTTAGTLISVGNVHHALGDYRKALDVFQQSLDVLEEAAGPYHSLTQMALANMARSAAALGEVEDAVAYQVRVEQIVEKNIALNLRTGSERQKLAYLEAVRQRTWRTVSLNNQYAPEDPAAAHLAAEVVLQRKGRVLDAMADASALIHQQLGAEGRELLRKLQATTSKFAGLALNGPGRMAFADYTKELRSLEQQQESLEAEISRRSGAFKASTQPLTLAAVQGVIPADAALIEFIAYQKFLPRTAEERLSYGEPRYAAYLIRSTGSPVRADLGPAARIESAVSRFRASLRDPARRDVKKLARTLDALVFEPLRAELGGATRLLISPDGVLNLVPFEALVDVRGRYAIQSYAISYLTSGRDLLRLHVPRERHTAPLVLADPEFGEPKDGPVAVTTTARARRRSVTTTRDLATTYFAPLAGTAAEAKSIRTLFPNATVLTRDRATKAALRGTQAPGILHIASHGFFLEDITPPPGTPGTRTAAAAVQSLDNPLIRSGMALAQANARRSGADSGILTALEATNLNLWGTQLVTLSACDTGVGEIKNGEGVYGLRRAFLLAGAESLVMSLWPVSDLVTRRMMTTYYTGLKQGQGRGDALRRAQLSMLKGAKEQHPYFWAGFIQAGAWTPLHLTDGQ